MGERIMKIGTIVRLKRECMENPAGTLGVVFYDYGDGFQAIFENGNYDGFSTVNRMSMDSQETEADCFLETVGFEPSLAGYQFRSVIQVEADFSNGVFDKVWRK